TKVFVPKVAVPLKRPAKYTLPVESAATRNGDPLFVATCLAQPMLPKRSYLHTKAAVKKPPGTFVSATPPKSIEAGEAPLNVPATNTLPELSAATCLAPLITA